MAFQLEPLPYDTKALEPHISEETIEFHYGKHHRGYVVKLNELSEGTEIAKKSLDDVVTTESGKIFNLAAQVCFFVSFDLIVDVNIFINRSGITLSTGTP